MPSTEELIKKVEQLFIAEKNEEAIALLTEDVLEKENNADLYAWSARINNALGNLDLALQLANKAIQINSRCSLAYYVIGNIASRNRDHKTAAYNFTKSIEINNNFPSAYYNRGSAWGNLSEFDKAIADFTKTIELNNDYQAYYYRG